MGRNKRKKSTKRMKGSIEQRIDVENSILSYTTFCWSIRNYRDLKNYALYYQAYEDNHLSCVFKLIKTKETFYLAVRCGIDRRRSYFYLDNGEWTSPVCISTEIARGLHIGHFSQSEIYKTGLLTIGFSILLDEEITDTGNYSDGLGEVWDFDDLCNDMGNMYLQGNNSDFTIKSVGASFKVHKYILLVRSEFFKEFFTNRNHPRKYSVEANADIMRLVLSYCYSGQLPHVTEDCLKSIQGVAEELKISSLVERCREDLGRDRIDDTQFENVSPDSQSDKETEILPNELDRFLMNKTG